MTTSKLNFRKNAWRVLSALAFWSATTAPVSATVVLQPAISSAQGSSPSPNQLQLIVDQSGLSSPYTSGATDFDTYTASATHDSASANSGYTGTSGGFPQHFIFDLGSAQTISALAFWAAGPAGGSVTDFRLFDDTDGNPFNGSGPQFGSFTALANGGSATPAQVFTFAPITTQFVHLIADNAAGGITPSGIGEAAFAVVPELASSQTIVAVALLIVAGCTLYRRRIGLPKALYLPKLFPLEQ